MRLMSWAFAVAAVLAVATGSAAADAWSNAPPPLYDPVFLNLGFVCRWEARCMDRQDDAMKRALKYVRTKHPPAWRVHPCKHHARGQGAPGRRKRLAQCPAERSPRPPPPT